MSNLQISNKPISIEKISIASFTARTHKILSGGYNYVSGGWHLMIASIVYHCPAALLIHLSHNNNQIHVVQTELPNETAADMLVTVVNYLNIHGFVWPPDAVVEGVWGFVESSWGAHSRVGVWHLLLLQPPMYAPEKA